MTDLDQDLGKCVQDKDNLVLEQNAASKLICGEKSGQECTTCASKEALSHTSLKDTPLSQARLTVIHNQLCMVFTIPGEKSTSRLIHKLEEWFQHVKDYIETSPLTQTEKDIAIALLEKKSNQTLLDEFYISKSTLKTHLNHIYHKLPLIKDIRDYLQSY